MGCLDLIFPLVGKALPASHSYSLYGAVCRLAPAVHESRDIGIFRIRGTGSGDGGMNLDDRSALRIRLPEQRIRDLLPLAGKGLEIDGHKIRVGAPRIAALVPAATLKADLVVIKIAHATGNTITPDLFLASVRKQLAALNVPAEPSIPLVQTGPNAGKPRRKVLEIKGEKHVGYSLILTGLTAEESIRVQEAGIGGRRGMGCGLFVAMREGSK